MKILSVSHPPEICFDTTQITSKASRGATAPQTFQTRIGRSGRGQPTETCPTLQGASAGETSDMRPCVLTPTMAVRRLLPRECASLMGFPRDYLEVVAFNGRCPPADGPMYRAYGNSMVTNELAWIGKRIELVDETMAAHQLRSL